MNVLITGATGFVGGAVVCKLVDGGSYAVRAAVRQLSDKLPDAVTQVCVGDLAASTSYTQALQGIDVVVHAAARVHVMSDAASDPLLEFRKVNVEGTLNLARQAVEAGVKRFIFISSIKVNGEATHAQAFAPDDVITTDDPYGLSKWEAEQGLFQLAATTGLEVVVIRPPLIYGPGVKANFEKMIAWVNRGVPLPLGAVHNQRSLLALDNLVSFISHCMDHPKAANEVFLIADGEDVSTTALLQKVAHALGEKACLLPVPTALMRMLASLMGKQDVVNRLFGSLQVDSSKARVLLGWKPVISMDGQLKKMLQADQ